MHVGKLTSEGKQEFDGRSDEVAQPGVSNGDVHLLFYAKHPLKKQQEKKCELLVKGLFGEGNLEMLGGKLEGRLSLSPLFRRQGHSLFILSLYTSVV